jgi:3-oxoacyl-[acyl-carrier-protein] synthase-3
MGDTICTVITGTGCHIPTERKLNQDFESNIFYDAAGEVLPGPSEDIVAKCTEITGISERRYVPDNLVASDIAADAARNALAASGIDPESLDYIVVAHNWGDVAADNRRTDIMPSIAARVKHELQIQNPNTVAYDIAFGCPGWLQALIQVDYYIKSGDASRALVIAAETLSRISDPHDRDSMIYADGAGAAVLEARTSSEPIGILAHAARSDTFKHAYLLRLGKSNRPDWTGDDLFLKMNGHEVFKYALRNVPLAVKASLDKAGLSIQDISQILLHQANVKMDKAILDRVFGLYEVEGDAEALMPMTVGRLGNSSVATVPTLLDLLVRGQLDGYHLNAGDNIIMASVGAGMNINSIIYRAY